MKAVRAFSMTVLGMPAIVCAGWAIFTLVRGQYLTMLVALGCTVFWLTPLLAWAKAPTVVARGTTHATGTTIRVDRRVDVLLFICVVAGAAALGSTGVLGAMNKLDIPLPPDIGTTFASAFIGPALVFLVALGLTVKRGGIGYVRLTTEGFEFVEAFSQASGEWSQVTDVTDKAPDEAKARSPLVMMMADGDPEMIKESALFTPDGRALLEFVRFYWQHPENRGELTDDRALERLQIMQLEAQTGASS